MSIDCVLYPKRKASTEELKLLGEAMHRWYQHESEDGGIAHWLSGEIHDLLAGELPKSKALQWMGIARDCDGNIAEEDREWIKAAFPGGGERSLRFAVSGYKYNNRHRTIQSLREFLPAELIDEILIDGRSWKDVSDDHIGNGD